MGAVTSNQTLIKWIPRMRAIGNLLDAPESQKIEDIEGASPAKVRVAYQTLTAVEWAGATVALCGRTLEECFGLENARWCQSATQRPLGLKLKTYPVDAFALAAGLHKRVTGRTFDKTKFALQVLACDKREWDVPSYIGEGLIWLAEQVALEVRQEAEAVAEAVSATE